MTRSRLALVALVGLSAFSGLTLASSSAHADWRYGGYGRGGYGYGHGYGYHRGPGAGAIVGGALLGLGVGALLAAPVYAPPPVVYAPPPAYYPPPAYAYAPAYPAPYYPPPGYYR